MRQLGAVASLSLSLSSPRALEPEGSSPGAFAPHCRRPRGGLVASFSCAGGSFCAPRWLRRSGLSRARARGGSVMLRSRGARKMLVLAFAVGAAAVGLVSTWGLANAAADLPDGRVYEQVSPANKNGNYVASGGIAVPSAGFGYAATEAGGDAVVFLGSGAMGEAASSTLQPYVARRTPGAGWSTTSVVPAQQGHLNLFGGPVGLLASANMSRFVFTSNGRGIYSPEEPLRPGSVNIYLSEDPFVAPLWLGKPSTPDAIPQPGEIECGACYRVVGGSPSLSTVYFTYSGTLIAQDASRAPNVGDGQNESPTDAWGFYEWSGGTLAEAGVLPDGTVSPFGAVPAALAGDAPFRNSLNVGQPAALENEVSADGSRAFFVSPDPRGADERLHRSCMCVRRPRMGARARCWSRSRSCQGTLANRRPMGRRRRRCLEHVRSPTHRRRMCMRRRMGRRRSSPVATG